jgi:hypothetical protein
MISILLAKVVGILYFDHVCKFIVHTMHLTLLCHNFISDLSSKFFVPFQMGPQEWIVAVSVCNLVSPLIVYPNCGGKNKKKTAYLCYVAKEEMDRILVTS